MSADPRAAASYLRSLPLERVFTDARRRLARYGPAAGVPGDLTAEERRALEGLLGRRLAPGRGVRLDEVDAALRRSRFACGLEEALTAWLGPSGPTPSQIAAAFDTDYAAFVDGVAGDWPAVRDPAVPAARALRREFSRARGAGAVGRLGQVASAVGRLAARSERAPAARPLPVVANELLGDPHALDPDTPGGRLLLAALGGRPGAASTERQALLATAGLAADGVSSTVAVLGLAAPEDAAAVAAAAHRQVYVAPLRAVAAWGAGPWRGRAVHAVENPAVFEALVDRGLPADVALVCVSGFPSAAALTLLAWLAQAGALVRYGGDFDGNGLVIARRVLAQGGGADWTLWRMAPADHVAALAVAPGRALRAAEAAALGRLAADLGDTPLAACARAILAAGRVAYQETLVAQLWADLRGAGGG